MNEIEYEASIREISCLIDKNECPAPGESDFARVDSLVDAVVAYERIHFPIAPPSPEASELFRREQTGETVDWTQISPRREKGTNERGQ